MSDKNNKALSTHEAFTVTKRDWVLILLRYSFHLFHYGLGLWVMLFSSSQEAPEAWREKVPCLRSQTNV